jgi:hypothetical protein
MTPGQLATEEAKAARTVAAYAMVRAMLARDTWTMARILDRWATGPGAEGMDFAAAVAGAGAALAIGSANGDRDCALSEADEALTAALARKFPASALPRSGSRGTWVLIGAVILAYKARPSCPVLSMAWDGALRAST